ncbi:MAG: AhpC/TSA family protein [Actinomycetota bacterium]
MVTQLRDRYREVEEADAQVIAIGMGFPEMAAHFKKELEIPFPLLVDHTKETYRALAIGSASPWNVYGPPVWIRGIRSILEYGNKIPKQDPFQLGGAAVVDKSGEILYLYRSRDSSDTPPVDEVLDALR